MARVRPTPIVALDVTRAADALALVETLGDRCRFYKVGAVLFAAEGPPVVRHLRAEGADVFLDLKFHDIPNTVRGAVAAATELGVRLLTVHAAGGRAMVEAAVQAASDACEVFAVTVLTSMDDRMLREAAGRGDVAVVDEVLRLARLARAAGAAGVVCSGAEAPRVRAEHGDALGVLVPGVRLDGGNRHDQARVVTPGEAATAGARYVVLGRAVTEAADPRAAMDAVWRALDRAESAGSPNRAGG